jgi:HK97 gp10 family phage protein
MRRHSSGDPHPQSLFPMPLSTAEGEGERHRRKIGAVRNRTLHEEGMTVRVSFKLTGFEQYLEKMANVPGLLDKAIDRANVAGADVILEGMLRRVPVLTGNLKNSLDRSEPKADGNVRFVEIGMGRKGSVDAETARYGNVMEYGSSSAQAQPYIRPAFDEDRTAARKAQRESLKKDSAI